MIFAIVLFSITLLILIKYFQIRGKTKIPNGAKKIPQIPGGLPVIGHLFPIRNNSVHYLTDLRDKYGPIFSIRIGWDDIIVVSNYYMMNKTLKEQGNNFTGRWQNVFTTDLALHSGILFTEKDWWATQRSFTLRVLRDFGFGKRLAEDVVHRQAEILMNTIRSKSGEGIDTNELVSLATVNIISDFIMKKEFLPTDKAGLAMIMSIKQLGQAADINSMIMNMFPIFQWYPKFSIWLIGLLHPLNIIQTVNHVTDYIGVIIEEHRKVFNPVNECEDLVDAFLYEQHKLETAGEKYESFTNWQLVRLISELFLAGFETTSTTLCWTFLLIAKHPDVQKKLREDIVRAIGTDRLPTMNDKRSLNYGQAVIDELYRYSTVLPLSIAHRSLDSAVVDGYFIPANSVIFPNIFACHRDPSVWTKPYDFYPEHFLDELGNYKPKQELITFGIGKRQCLGEGLAKMEEFIVLVSFIQKFEIALTEHYAKMDIVKILGSTDGTFRATLEHKLYFKEITSSN